MALVAPTLFESGVWEKASHAEKSTYITIIEHYNSKTRIAFPGPARIGELNGMHRDNVKLYTRRILKRGLLVKKQILNQQGNFINAYIVPDLLVLEIKLMFKNPKKNVNEITKLIQVALNAIGGIINIPTGIKNYKRGDKNYEKEGYYIHPNYLFKLLINYKQNLDDFFNLKDLKKPKSSIKNQEILKCNNIKEELPGKNLEKKFVWRDRGPEMDQLVRECLSSLVHWNINKGTN